MLLTLMGNNWMFTTERSGWWRLRIAEMTQKGLDERNALRQKAELKLEGNTPPIIVKQPKKKIKATPRLKLVKRPEPESLVPSIKTNIIAPIQRPMQPSMREMIGEMTFTTYSTTVYKTEYAQHKNVVELASRSKKKREEEEFLILLAA